MRITFWTEDGDPVAGLDDAYAVPPLGARLDLKLTADGSPLVVVEHWYGRAPGSGYANHWHVVLRPAETPAEKTPPWERGKDT